MDVVAVGVCCVCVLLDMLDRERNGFELEKEELDDGRRMTSFPANQKHPR
jgi:hypothetical protein